MFTYMKLEEFIPDYYQDALEDYLSNGQIWSFDDNVSGMKNEERKFTHGLELAQRQYGFSSRIYSEDLGWDTEERLFAMLQPMIFKVMNLFPIDLDVYRVRGGMMTKQNKNGLNHPHVDFHFPHYTFLYYANDSDGDTFIFNEKVDPSLEQHEMPKEFTLMERFSPKKGDAILFNGLLYHSSSTPVLHDTRIAVNINLVPVNEV